MHVRQLGRLGLALALGCTLPDAARAADLPGALAVAYDANAQINAQRAATRAADEAIAIARSGYRPQVFSDVNFGFARTVSRQSSTGISATQVVNGQIVPGTPRRTRRAIGTSTVPFSYGITISQPLFSGFQTVNSVNQAEAQVRASRSQLRTVTQSVFLGVAQAFADIFLARELVRVRQRNISFLNEQVRSADARLEVGEGTRTDVAQSRARLEQGRALVTSSQSDVLTARAALQQFVGRPIEATAAPRIPRRLIPGSLSSALNIGLARHPDIRRAEHFVDAQAFAVKQAEGALLPSLSANLSGTESYDLGVADARRTNLQGTLQLRIPIYQAGRQTAQIRQAKEVLGQRRIELDSVRDQIRQEIRSAWALLQQARSNLRSSAAQVSAAQLALSGVIEERNVGQRTQLDVLQAQSSVLSAQETRAQARRLEVVAAYNLIAATGRLSSRNLGLRVDHYDPKEHYVVTVDRWYGLRTPDER